MGGEKPALPDVPVAEIGSPPRGRGKVLAALMPENRLRITPAWAGKRLHLDVKDKPAQDHPRVGGEKRERCRDLPRGLGSPPRGRGKEHAAPAGHTAAGITPAWAGKSFSMTARGRVRKDHPRVGGEKFNPANV